MYRFPSLISGGGVTLHRVGCHRARNRSVTRCCIGKGAVEPHHHRPSTCCTTQRPATTLSAFRHQQLPCDGISQPRRRTTPRPVMGSRHPVHKVDSYVALTLTSWAKEATGGGSVALGKGGPNLRDFLSGSSHAKGGGRDDDGDWGAGVGGGEMSSPAAAWGGREGEGGVAMTEAVDVSTPASIKSGESNCNSTSTTGTV